MFSPLHSWTRLSSSSCFALRSDLVFIFYHAKLSHFKLRLHQLCADLIQINLLVSNFLLSEQDNLCPILFVLREAFAHSCSHPFSQKFFSPRLRAVGSYLS